MADADEIEVIGPHNLYTGPSREWCQMTRSAIPHFPLIVREMISIMFQNENTYPTVKFYLNQKATVIETNEEKRW